MSTYLRRPLPQRFGLCERACVRSRARVFMANLRHEMFVFTALKSNDSSAQRAHSHTHRHRNICFAVWRSGHKAGYEVASAVSARRRRGRHRRSIIHERRASTCLCMRLADETPPVTRPRQFDRFLCAPIASSAAPANDLSIERARRTAYISFDCNLLGHLRQYSKSTTSINLLVAYKDNGHRDCARLPKIRETTHTKNARTKRRLLLPECAQTSACTESASFVL